ncbi:unnamed protein product [Coregonus sp. 'balchen']|nr:unnamed protein product [Coregonus sp. 'balchen']
MSADSRLGAEVSRIADNEESVMLMLGRCLPHIVPNVLLAKREELIPLILCTACLHPEPKERDQLLHILFNLIKRPDDEQRRMILTGCVAFARHVGPTRIEAELLPQCWEQINHKYSERRLLVAEACGALAPYLPKEIRSSLVLSMLQQMLAEDKADMVREAVVKSLAIIMGYIDDPDKYSQGFELMLLSLGDPSERVVSAIHQVFIPAFAAWTTELGNLQTTLIPSLLARIEKLLKNAPFTHRVNLKGNIPPIEVTRFPRPASPLQDLATIVGSRETLSALLILLPQLIEIVGRINVTSTTCVHEFSRFFWRLCRTFGKIFTNTKVKPQFQEILRLSEENVDALTGNGILTKATVPVYATGVLTCYSQDEDRKLLVGFLEDVMTTLSLSHAPLDSLKASFIELGVVPALITLSSDPEMTFGRVGPNADPRFRDEFVLPHLHKLALVNNVQATDSKRIDIATQLFEAYSALSCCFISEELMVNHFLPGLRCLRTDMEQLSPEHEVILTSMIKEGEMKVENRGIGQAEGSVSIAASLVGEDAKTKFLSKMGQLTTSGAMLANVFQRKK